MVPTIPYLGECEQLPYLSVAHRQISANVPCCAPEEHYM